MIFKDEEVLSSEYLPEILPHRETQISQIANNLRPAAQGRKVQNTFIFGSPGIGKTATTKFIFRKFEEEHPGVKTIYINCWDFNTAIAVLSKMTIELGSFITRRGLGKDEVMQRFVEAFSKTKQGLVVCLDEVDQLIFKDQGALYDILRINQYTGKEIGLVLISNNQHIFSRLEPRVMSSLNAEEIEFKPYSISEMRKILEERAKFAFVSFEPAALLLAANQAVQKKGDVRVGLQCLYRAGKIAEQEGESKLRISHMKKILTKISNPRNEIIKKELSKNERLIVDLVNKSSELSFSELYKKYCDKMENPVSERMFQDYVKHLSQSKLLKLSEKKINGRRIVSKI